MDTLEFEWLGQSFFRIISPGGKVIYVDPWKDFPPGNNLFPKDYRLGDADVILVTHGHLDHLGDTVNLAKDPSHKPNLKVISVFEIHLYLLEQGVSADTLQAINTGGSVVVDGIKYSFVQARHSSGIGMFGPNRLSYGGEAGGFVIRLENGKTIYHAGDTDLFSDMELISRRYRPEIVMLPIGGVFTMDPESAAEAVKLINPKKVVPMHYGGSFGLPGSPEDFRRFVAEKNPQTEVIIPAPGETVRVDM